MSDNDKTTARVIVTRPASQSDRLSALIEDAGGVAIRIPALEIAASNQPDEARTFFEQLDNYQFLVFISPNAVRFSLGLFNPDELTEQKTVAIGASTASAMQQARINCDIFPEGSYTSEALLELEEFKDVDGANVLIVRGNGGRALLGTELEKRGATVDYAEVYTRQIPADSKEELSSILTSGEADMITANSVETLTNLLTITDDEQLPALKKLQLVTGSSRVERKAVELGFQRAPLLAEGPDDVALLKAIVSYTESPPASELASVANIHSDSKQQQETSAANADEPDNENSDRIDSDSDAALEKDQDKPMTNEANSEPETPPVPPAKRAGGGIAWLALLTALLSAAGTGWMWWQDRQQQPVETAELVIPTAEEILGEVRQETQRDANRFTGQLQRQEEQLEGALDKQSEFASSIRTQKRSVENLTEQLSLMEQNISAMRGVSANVRNTWIRAETEYFLQTANTRLQLAGDVKSAVQALRAADERIVALGDPSLTPVRGQLSEELLALESIPQLDIEGVALTLNSLASRVSNLRLKNITDENYVSVNQADEEKGGWGRAKRVVSGALSDVIQVSPIDDTVPAMLTPEQTYFLYRNLELQLQVARLAALQGKQETFDNSVATSLEWLQQYFDPNDNGVSVVKQKLGTLTQQKIAHTLPDISRSLNMLRAMAPSSRSSGTDPAAQSPDGEPSP